MSPSSKPPAISPANTRMEKPAARPGADGRRPARSGRHRASAVGSDGRRDGGGGGLNRHVADRFDYQMGRSGRISRAPAAGRARRSAAAAAAADRLAPPRTAKFGEAPGARRRRLAGFEPPPRREARGAGRRGRRRVAKARRRPLTHRVRRSRPAWEPSPRETAGPLTAPHRQRMGPQVGTTSTP